VTRLACLHGEDTSLVLELTDSLGPLWRHWGARVAAPAVPPLADLRPAASFSFDGDVPFGPASCTGLGWFGPSAIEASRNGAPLDFAWTIESCDTSADRLTLRLRDHVARVVLEQRIVVEPGGAFRFAASVTNTGQKALTVDWLASAMLPLPADSSALVSWRGRHNAELVECRDPMPEQRWTREGRRGLSSHGGPPGVFVLGENAGWSSGEVRALQLCWSGDSRIAVERDDEGFWILSAGAVTLPGEITLQPGETRHAPDALAAFSSNGRNGAIGAFHAAVRAMIGWPGGAISPRKVHLNSWEACYFDHDASRIIGLAEQAASIGIERFVLDDGWFKGRNDDTAGLGDWTPDPLKYPDGLGPLARKVNDLGMEFGLWVEPEMINPDSDLYRAHPDWALASAGRARPTARNQLVLDMRRQDVRDYLFGCIDTVLREVPIGYLKWDHNRDLAPAGGADQVAGTMDLMHRIRTAHPGVEIEACAGGGGRNDAGWAPFVHRYWTSDNIDAVSRVSIQRGFLSFLPPEMMGAHVGASPAHATGRSQSMGFRAAVAMPGHFGVELHPGQIEAKDRADLAEWIAFHKQWRSLLHGGTVHMGEAADGVVWQAQGNARELLLFVTRCAPPHDRRPQPLRLPFVSGPSDCNVRLLRIAGGLHGHAAATTALHERMAAHSVTFDRAWLASNGLPLPAMKAESVAIFHLELPA
jgi:alpha-galactosidase